MLINVFDFYAHLNGVCLCVSVPDSNARLYTRRDWQIIEISQFDQIQVPVIEAAVFSLHHTAKPARCASRHEGLVISVASIAVNQIFDDVHTSNCCLVGCQSIFDDVHTLRCWQVSYTAT